MDEANRLVLELHDKLAELDLRVWNYRRDMVAEFTRYTEDLLRTVPSEISETVSKIIAQDMKEYKSLYFNAPQTSDLTVTGNNDGPERATQPYLTQQSTFYAYNTAHDPEQHSPRALHEQREHDFQGLFTPTYLPLLDHPIQRRPSSNYSPTSSYKGKGKEMEERPGEDTHPRAPGAVSDLGRPSQPVRRGTDELSIGSNHSDGQVRRSALRRSSDNSKLQSPRRVRFDVMGEEVLPTSSPQRNDSPIEGVASYLDDYEVDELESLEINDEEDSPPQKRISTSEALQMLSRQPLEDDGTQWITVTSGLDGEPVDIISNTTSNAGVDNGDADTADDDPLAHMSPLLPMKGKRSITVDIPTGSAAPAQDNKPSKSPTPPGKTYFSLDTPEETGNTTTKTGDDEEEDLIFLGDDEDELFPFDESRPKQKILPEEVQEDSDSDSDVGLEMGSKRPSPADPNLSRSPPVNIPGRMAISEPSSVPKASVGSYKGHPFNLPIVSEELHAQAASLGVVNTFVGSVTGRSGLDPSDVQSFRESLRIGAGSFTGEPKSMMERMMMEDFMEAEKERSAKQKAADEKAAKQKAEAEMEEAEKAKKL